MNNSRFLINYPYLIVKKEDFAFLGFDDISILNHNLNELITSFDPALVSLIGDIKVKEKSLNIDLDALRNKLCSLFNLEFGSNTAVKLRKILKRINNERANALIEYPYIYLLFPHLDNSYKNRNKEFVKSYAKSYFNAYLLRIQRSIKLLIDFLEQENKYTKINLDGVKENRLALYLAYQVMHKAKSCKKDNNVGFTKAINYLTSFINDNKAMIEMDFKFSGNGKLYSINEIVTYLSNVALEESKKSEKEKNTSSIKVNYSDYEYEKPIIRTRRKGKIKKDWV